MTEESVTDVAGQPSEKPARQHAAEPHDRAAEAQRLIEVALAELPDERWTVLHDIRWPGHQHKRVDHVVVTPAGVFVIDSLGWNGLVHIWEGTLYHDGIPQKAEIADAVEAAAAVGVLTPGVPKHAVFPVLCVAREQRVKGQAGRVLICSAATLVDIIDAQVHVLSSEQRRVAVKQLEERLHNRSAVKVASRVAHSNEKQSARRRRRAKHNKPVEQHSSVGPYKRPRNGSLVPLLMAVGAGVLFIGFPGFVMEAAATVRDFLEQASN